MAAWMTHYFIEAYDAICYKRQPNKGLCVTKVMWTRLLCAVLSFSFSGLSSLFYLVFSESTAHAAGGDFSGQITTTEELLDGEEPVLNSRREQQARILELAQGMSGLINE